MVGSVFADDHWNISLERINDPLRIGQRVRLNDPASAVSVRVAIAMRITDRGRGFRDRDRMRSRFAFKRQSRRGDLLKSVSRARVVA